ncbi:hypothetical protein AVEN_179446-1 [Araneus ventricosus]|uniref:Uncharacterized protein n=1 Tax=Araneus ventricosus TaxID=182803 RepID=A0A4Y2BGW6_ARAVE|nr:hypothetical protein AVEN_179446-1 [Araneus ventricosus]
MRVYFRTDFVVSNNDQKRMTTPEPILLSTNLNSQSREGLFAHNALKVPQATINGGHLVNQDSNPRHSCPKVEILVWGLTQGHERKM